MKRFFVAAALLMGTTLLAGAQDFEGKKVPAEFTVDLNFAESNNPFTSPCVRTKDQTPEGETYTYEFGKGAKACKLNFVISKGVNDNFYSFGGKKNNFINWLRPEAQPDNCGFIRIPAVPGRYLKSIELTIATSSAMFFLCSAPEKVIKGEGLVAKFKAPDKGTVTKNFAYPETEVNTPYYLFRNNSTALRIVDMKLTYSSVKKGKK